MYKCNQFPAVFRKICFLAATAGLVVFSGLDVRGFALLGPFEPWMTATNGFYPNNGDIGGPMSIGHGFRWNVPVVTYGFDPSFVKFFGSNGVAAVQGAIQMLNTLPPASQIVLSNYFYDTSRINFRAESQGLYDLKSETLSLLVEQMGLAQPTRSVFVLRRWNPIFATEGFTVPGGEHVFPEVDWTPDMIPYNISERNFDPNTFASSLYVNGVFYDGEVTTLNGNSVVDPIVVDPQQQVNSYDAVADQSLNTGQFYMGFTFDDVGGLTYLLSSNNINYETLLPDAVPAGTNASPLVNGAWRPGVEKITLIPQAVDAQSGAFTTMTNDFTDTYITNGVAVQQQVARVTSRPDFLFSADSLVNIWGPPLFTRTGTTNWRNNALANGNTNGNGPGVIQPPVQIVFNKLGKQYYSDVSEEQIGDQSSMWGSFDATTNEPFVYPESQTGTNEMTVHMWLFLARGVAPKSFEWKPVSAAGTQYAFQTSTNLAEWVTLFTITNNTSIFSYFDFGPNSASRFYRLVPQ